MGAVEEKVRAAGEQRFVRNDESPFTTRLREKVAELEGKLDKARTAGRPTEELEAALTTQRQWLSQAGGGGAATAAPGGAPTKAAAPKKKTGGWVRADSGGLRTTKGGHPGWGARPRVRPAGPDARPAAER